jgi:hypothetical protein
LHVEEDFALVFLLTALDQKRFEEVEKCEESLRDSSSCPIVRSSKIKNLAIFKISRDLREPRPQPLALIENFLQPTTYKRMSELEFGDLYPLVRRKIAVGSHYIAIQAHGFVNYFPIGHHEFYKRFKPRTPYPKWASADNPSIALANKSLAILDSSNVVRFINKDYQHGDNARYAETYNRKDNCDCDECLRAARRN